MVGCLTDPEVVLVNANRWKPAIAPLALDYLGAALEKKGVAYDILDLCFARSPARAIRSFLADKSPRLIGVSFRNLDDILCAISFLEDLRQTVGHIRAAAPDASLVLGGSGFSVAPEKILEYCDLDLGVWGEGEEALPLLLERLGDESAYESIPGLVYRAPNGFVRNPQGAMSVSDFSAAGTGMKALKGYVNDGRFICGVGVQTKRGCPNRCGYCVVPNCEGTSRRLRPAGIIADEIEHAVSLGVCSVFLADSEFNDPPDHAAAVSEEIIRRGLEQKMTWTTYITCFKFDRELASIMKRAGCVDAICDFDSANDAILEKLGKRHRQADILATAEAARETGLTVTYPVLIGAPGETLETLEATIDFLRRHGFKRVSATEPAGIRIYPETPIADCVFEEGFSRKNPNLWGAICRNEDLLFPVYYISAGLGPLRRMMTGWRRLILAYYGAFPRTRFGLLRNRSPLC